MLKIMPYKEAKAARGLACRFEFGLNVQLPRLMTVSGGGAERWCVQRSRAREKEEETPQGQE